MNEVLYAVVVWLTASGATTGIFEAIDAPLDECETYIAEIVDEAASRDKTVVATCTTHLSDAMYLIEVLTLKEEHFE